MPKKESGPVPQKTLTKSEVEEWLRKASVRELNIFVDKNAIIVWLCRALLSAWNDSDSYKGNP